MRVNAYDEDFRDEDELSYIERRLTPDQRLYRDYLCGMLTEAEYLRLREEFVEHE